VAELRWSPEELPQLGEEVIYHWDPNGGSDVRVHVVGLDLTREDPILIQWPAGNRGTLWMPPFRITRLDPVTRLGELA
jgi:hypothetical protein